VSVPAPPFGPAARPFGAVSFALGFAVALALVVYAGWLAIAGATALGHAAGAAAQQLRAAAPHPAAARPAPATSLGTTLAFDQLWTAPDGNTIVAWAPLAGTSGYSGQPVIQVAVTLANNGEREWNPAAFTFRATLNQAPAPETTEGNWMYTTPIAAHTSVTLTKVFAAAPGQFTLAVHTPQGVAVFTGWV
jgi:hypothetical protein